eukprot:2504728-Pleurochrysis_carterae.AAC.1
MSCSCPPPTLLSLSRQSEEIPYRDKEQRDAVWSGEGSGEQQQYAARWRSAISVDVTQRTGGGQCSVRCLCAERRQAGRLRRVAVARQRNGLRWLRDISPRKE